MKRKILIYYPRSPDNTKLVEAEIFGPLAVHPNVNPSASIEESWRITHIRSGRSLKRVQYEWIACRLAERLSRSQVLCWNFGNFPENLSCFLPKPKSFYREQIALVEEEINSEPSF